MLETLKKLFKRKPEFGYVSDIDKFLATFDAEHSQKSLSQISEINKHKRIFELRDNSHPEKITAKITDFL